MQAITAVFFSYGRNLGVGNVKVSAVGPSTSGPAVWFPALIFLVLDVELRTRVLQAQGTRA